MPGFGSAFAPSAYSLATSSKSARQSAIGGMTSPPNGKARPGRSGGADGAPSPLIEESSPPFGDPTPVEERLEAELHAPPLDPVPQSAAQSGAGLPVDYLFGLSELPLQKELPLEVPKKPLDDSALENLSEEDAMVELAALRLQRACQDMVDEARAEKLMSRIVRNREETFHLDEDEQTGSDDFFGGSGGEPPSTPRTFSRRVSARRLALAASAIALIVAAPLTLGGDPTKWPDRISAFFAPAPVVAASAVEWRRDTIVRSGQSAAVDQVLTERRDSAWRVNLAERLAKQALPIGEENPGGSAEAGLQEWHDRNGERTVRVVPDEAVQSQSEVGVTLAIANAIEEAPDAGGVGNAALAGSIVRIDGKATAISDLAKSELAESELANSGAGEAAKTELAALASPRPQDVLAAATAREAERKAVRTEESKPAPRDPGQVEVALAAAPAIAELRPSQRKELAVRLAGGECLATSLGDYFSPVPVLLMRDLIQNLDSEC